MLDFNYFRPCAPVSEAERKIDFEYFYDYDFRTTCGPCEQMDHLVEVIFADISVELKGLPKNPKHLEKRLCKVKNEIRSILWNFYLCAQADYDLYLKIPMGNNSYVVCSHKNPLGLRPDIRNVLSQMQEHGWVEIRKGYYGIEGKKSKVTRIRQTVKTAAFIENLPDDLIAVAPSRPSIKVKTQKDKAVLHNDQILEHAEIKKTAGLMDRLNHRIRQHTISMYGTSSKYLSYAFKNKGNSIGTKPIRLDDTQMSAVFHKTCQDTFGYGRMHGGVWQAMPSEFRQCLQIDGEPCVELDYSSQFLNIVASMNGIQLGDNAYVFDIGLPMLNDRLIKTIVKFAVLVGLGSHSLKTAIGGLRSQIIESDDIQNHEISLKDKDLKLIFDKIIEKYEFLKPVMFCGHSNHLFFEDSEVARAVIQVLLDRNKPIFPIHDGFVVKAEDEDLLMNAMRKAWEDRFNTKIQIKKEWGGAGYAYPSYQQVLAERIDTLMPNFDDHIS